MHVWFATYLQWVVLIHLTCAILFVGAAAFEVFVLEGLHQRFDAATMNQLETAVMARVRHYMPIVVILLFLSGFVLFDQYCNGIQCIGDGRHFGWLLLAKVTLAFAVLGVFANAIWSGFRGRMTVCRFRYTHRIVLTLMAGIVFLAKAMFIL